MKTYMNFRTETLENNKLKIEVIPELGGRIDSLVNKLTKKEWVWNNPTLEKNKVSKFSEYDSNWQGGWEELFPNDAKEKFSWGKGYDHGELWSAEWKVKSSLNNTLSLTTSNLDSGSSFNKEMRINDNKLTVDYSGFIPFSDYYLFKLHLAVPVTEKVKIDCSHNGINSVDKDFGNISDLRNEFFTLKKNSDLFGFAYIDLPSKNIKLVDEDLNTLELNYRGDLDYFWLFQTQGGWNGHNVLVLEPASNSKKYLNDAIKESGALRGPKEFKCSYSVIIDTNNE